MKKLFLFIFAPAFVLGMMFSCGGGGKELSEESHDGEEAAEEAMEAAPVYSGKTAVGVIHSVANVTEWAKVYNEVSVPQSRIGYFINVDNPNEVVVFEMTTSHEDARASFASEDLKAKMQRAGVNSEPRFIYYDMQYLNDQENPAEYLVGISHEVSDYEAWKVKFDADEARRGEAGLELRGLARDADNANMVHIAMATNDLEPIKSMMADPELKKVMEEGGVISEPIVYYWQVPNAQ